MHSLKSQCKFRACISNLLQIWPMQGQNLLLSLQFDPIESFKYYNCSKIVYNIITMISYRDIQKLIHPAKQILLLFVFLSLITMRVNSQQDTNPLDIILLNKYNFSKAQSQFQYLFVYFFSQECSECTQTTQLFYTLHSLTITSYKKTENPTTIQFAQVELHENEQLFEAEQIETVPLFRMYLKNSRHETYQLVTPSYQTLQLLEVWLHRVVNKELEVLPSLQMIKRQNSDKKWALINCNDKQLKQKLTSSNNYLINLEIRYGCLENSQIKTGKLLLVHNQFMNLMSDCEDGQLSWILCQNAMTNFRFRGILHLSNQIIHQIYHRNMSLVVAVTSNNAQSHNLLIQLNNLKYSIESQQFTQVLPIFVVADLNYNIQETIRMKKFIGGYEIAGSPHPYPLLAYLWPSQNNTIVKYIYETKYLGFIPSNISIKQWYTLAKSHSLTPDLRNRYAQASTQFFENGNHVITKINLNELMIVLGKIKKEGVQAPKPVIFVYVNWRTSWQMQVILSKVRKWWSSSKIDAHILQLDIYENQLPANVDLKYLPGLITYYDDQSFKVKQNITSSEQIINHINGYFKNNKAS